MLASINYICNFQGLLGFMGARLYDGWVFVSNCCLLRISANNDLIAVVCRHLWRGVLVGLWGCWDCFYGCRRFTLWWCRRHTFIAHYVCCRSECNICAWIQKHDSSIFRFMHKIWIILTADMTYTRSPNYTNMVVGKYGRPTLKVLVVVLLLLLLSFDIFVPTSAHPLTCLNKWFVQVLYLIVSFNKHTVSYMFKEQTLQSNIQGNPKSSLPCKL
jgi:hypothetical protein